MVEWIFAFCIFFHLFELMEVECNVSGWLSLWGPVMDRQTVQGVSHFCPTVTSKFHLTPFGTKQVQKMDGWMDKFTSYTFSPLMDHCLVSTRSIYQYLFCKLN